MKSSKVQKLRGSNFKKLWAGIGILILLSPLGIILQRIFKSEGAWGEWGKDKIEKMIGYAPEGLKRLSELWSSPMPDYTLSGWGSGLKLFAGYIFSGIIGVTLVVCISILVGKFLAGKNGDS